MLINPVIQYFAVFTFRNFSCLSKQSPVISYVLIRAAHKGRLHFSFYMHLMFVPKNCFLESGLLLKFACVCVCVVCVHRCIHRYKHMHMYLIYYAYCILYDLYVMYLICPLLPAHLFCIPLCPFINYTLGLSLAFLSKAVTSPSRTMSPSFQLGHF